MGYRAIANDAASTSQMERFETEVLTQPQHFPAMMELSGNWIEQVQQRRSIDRVILDLDSSVSETHGQQGGSAYTGSPVNNGCFECTCYYPLFCFNQFGDLERALLRTGNVAGADDWRSVLEPVVARYRRRSGKLKRYFRGDSGFANPELHAFVEAEGYLQTIRLPANAVPSPQIRHLDDPPGGAPNGKACCAIPRLHLTGRHLAQDPPRLLFESGYARINIEASGTFEGAPKIADCILVAIAPAKKNSPFFGHF